MNWFTDFPPSGPIYNSALPRVRETPKDEGPNSNLRPLRSSPFTSFILAWAHSPRSRSQQKGRQWYEQVAKRKDGS